MSIKDSEIEKDTQAKFVSKPAPKATSKGASKPAQKHGAEAHPFEGDYRPMDTLKSGNTAPINARIDVVDYAYLLRLSDALNTTLDLQTLLIKTAEMVRAILHYRIFAILLLNDRTEELRIRYQIGHTPETERIRVPVGKGIVGQAAETRQPMLVDDVTKIENYINVNPNVRSELAIPLITKNRVIGVIDIQSEETNGFTQEHLQLLKLTASRIAQTIENARLYARVARQAQALTVLNEIATELISILDLDQLLDRIGHLLRRLIDFQIFTIMLLDARGDTLITRYSWKYGSASAPRRRIPTTDGLVGAAVREWRLVNIPDVRKDPRYVNLNPETRSEMVVPLFYKSRIIGVLDLEHTRVGYFNEEHERTLSTLAAQVAIAIENARLYQTVTRHEQQLERDISMARQVQLRLLPATLPVHDHAEFAARFLPARSIGGDLYDFVAYDREHTAIMLGDVSGKAAPAALFAALVSGLMRSAAQQQPGPAEMLEALNEALQERKLESQYVTLVFAIWDDSNHTLRVANAGGTQPMFCRAGKVSTIKAEGFPLGLFTEAKYEEFTVSAQPGDVFAFCSDGITDAHNPQEEMFGEERLANVICAHRELTASQIAEAILSEVTRFQSGRERFDDETILVLKVR